MIIAVIDGQGGGIGRTIVEKLKAAQLPDVKILALGTNSAATGQMLKAGADEGATGENAIVHNMQHADIVCGVVGALMFHGILTDALCWVMELLDGIADLDLEGLMEHASLIALISIGIGMILQIWPAKWYATAHDNEPTWWAPFMFLTGILTSFLAALILALLGAAIVLIIFLIGIAIAIGVAILGFYIVSAFCCGG